MRRPDKRGLPGKTRPGFTLIELLVVIFIIAAIVALSAAGVLKFLSSQQLANTRSTLDRTQSTLNNAWSKAKDQAWKAPMTELVPGGGGQTVEQFIRNNLAGTDANQTGRTRVIFVKLYLRRAFPMNFNEAINPYPLPPLSAYSTYLANLGYGGSSGATYESSACLLMALERGVSGASINVSDLTKGGAAGSVTTPKGGTLPFLTDSWGQPIYFTRVPAGYNLVNPQPYPGPPGPGEPGVNDPGDPQGYLNAGGWPKTANTTLFTQLTLQPLAAQNCSYKLVPMLASSGADKTLSVDPIWFSATPAGNNGDDLFSTP